MQYCSSGHANIVNYLIVNVIQLEIQLLMMLCLSHRSHLLTSLGTQVPGSESVESIRKVQLADPMIGPVLRTKEEGKPPTAELTTAVQATTIFAR